MWICNIPIDFCVIISYFFSEGIIFQLHGGWFSTFFGLAVPPLGWHCQHKIFIHSLFDWTQTFSAAHLPPFFWLCSSHPCVATRLAHCSNNMNLRLRVSRLAEQYEGWSKEIFNCIKNNQNSPFKTMQPSSIISNRGF